MRLKRFTLAAVRHRANRTGRGQEYIDDVLAASEQKDEEHVWLTEESVQSIKVKWELTHSSRPQPIKTPPRDKFIDSRLAVCQECEYCIDDKKCGVLTARGKAGVLLSSKGLYNPRAQCPIGKWKSLEFVIVTSLSPNPMRFERQESCLSTWRKLGVPIFAVQLESEIESLRYRFPFISFVKTDRTYPGKKNIWIKDMAMVAVKEQMPVMLINSDIEILAAKKDFFSDWQIRENELRMASRWEYAKGLSDAAVQGFGIDVFLLSQQMAESLPEIPLSIGIPFWDYWLPYHFRELGYNITLDQRPHFFHKRHKATWSKNDWYDAYEIFKDAYEIEYFDPHEFRKSLGPWGRQ